MLIYLAMIESDEDKSKFEQLYNTYKQTMFYVANNILKDEYLSEDAVHQAFMRIIDHFDKIGEIKSHKTKGFIVIITERIAIDIYRKRKKQNAVSFEEVEFGIGEIAATVEDIIEHNNYNPIAIAIASLPANYTSVLRLKYSHGYSDEEIAKILLISEDNVRQRIVRAKKKLAKVLEEMEIGPYE